MPHAEPPTDEFELPDLEAPAPDEGPGEDAGFGDLELDATPSQQAEVSTDFFSADDLDLEPVSVGGGDASAAGGDDFVLDEMEMVEDEPPAGDEPIELLGEPMDIPESPATMPVQSQAIPVFEEAGDDDVEVEFDLESDAPAPISTDEPQAAEPVEELSSDDAVPAELRPPQRVETPDELVSRTMGARPTQQPQAAAEAARPEPVVFGEDDPFGEPFDSGPVIGKAELVTDLPPGGRAVVPKVSAPSLDPQDNQLQLRLEGTGAIAESGQVRALDITVPVPGTWVGNRRVTLQLRLTLEPTAEDMDGGRGGAS